MVKITNWAGTYSARARRLHEPASVEELQEIVAAARHLRVVGSRHCFNGIFDSGDELVSLAKLPRSVEVLDGGRAVTVGAAASYAEVCPEIDRHGLALANLASLPHISVAGACATATHGSGDRNGCLATSVLAVELVDGRGELRRVWRGDPDFPAFPVHLGALGVLTKLTLEVEPAYSVSQQVFERLPWEAIHDSLDEITGVAYSVSVFTCWERDAADQVWLKSRVGQGASDLDDLFGARPADGPRNPVPGASAANCTAQGGLPGPWWDRLPHFRHDAVPSAGEEIQTEYLVPRDRAHEAIAACRALSARITPFLQVSEIRTVAADDLWASPFYGQSCVGIHFTWHKDPAGVAGVLPLIEERLAPLGARPHWGKCFSMAAEQIRAAFSRLADFRRVAHSVDPRGVFVNDFLRNAGIRE